MDSVFFLLAEIPFPATFAELWQQLVGSGAAAHPFIQFVKYGIAGGISTVVHITTFFVAGWFLFPCVTSDDIAVRTLKLHAPDVEEKRRAMNAVYANIVAFVISNVVCFILNRIFVFEPGKHSVFVEFVLFFLVSAIAIGLGTCIMKWLISRFRMQTSLAFGANLFTSLMLNFVLRKFLIFNG